MQIKGNLKMAFTSKLDSMGFLKKYDFANMEYNISQVEHLDILFKSLIIKELEQDEVKTLEEIITYYFTRQYASGNSIGFCESFFRDFLNYIPDVDTCKKVIENSDVIYKYILDNEKGFYLARVYDKFCDNLFTAFQIIEFNRMKIIPQELRYLYENISYSTLLTNALEREYIKKYKETKDKRYRNALIEHYQRLVFKRILIYHKKYHLSYEILIDLSNKIIFTSIEMYNLNSSISLGNYIRNRFINYAVYISRQKTKNETISINMIKKESIHNKLEQKLELKELNELILNTSFNDKEMYVLLYGYGLFNFSKKKFNEIAKILGVSKEYIWEVKGNLLKKLRRALVLDSLKANPRNLSPEEKKIIKQNNQGFSSMQANCFRLFFKAELQDKEESLIDLETVLAEYLREDEKANYILRKRYDRDKYEDNTMVAVMILGYGDTFNPLTIEEYAYLYEVIVPTLKERLTKKQKRVLDLVKYSC